MTLLVRQNIYGAYLDGDVTAYEALRALADDYEELDQSYRDFAKMREQTREQISVVLAKMDGEKAEIKGFGVLRLTAAAVIERYNPQRLNDLAAQLTACGLASVAERILDCKELSARAGSLRIEREKPRDG